MAGRFGALAVASLLTLLAAVMPAVAPSAFARSAQAQFPTLEEAYDLLEREKWNRAASSFRGITRDEPTNVRAWLGLVEALPGKGDLAGALKAADQATELPRAAPKALYLRGCLLAEQGDLEGAVAALDRAVRIGFNDAGTMNAELALEPLRAAGRLPVPQGYEEVSVDLDGAEPLGYLLALPPGFRAGREYPVLVALGPGAQDLNGARYLMAHFVGEQAVQLGWVVAAPAAPIGGWTGAAGAATFEAFLDELQNRVRPEGSGFHLIGAGNGAYSAFVLAQHSADRFHSLTAMAGAPPPGPGLESLAGVKVRQFVGEMDGTWISSVREMHETLEAFGIDAELEILSGERHFVGSLAGDELIQRIDPLRPVD